MALACKTQLPARAPARKRHLQTTQAVSRARLAAAHQKNVDSQRPLTRLSAGSSRGGGETVAFQGVSSIEEEAVAATAHATAPATAPAKTHDTFAWTRNWWPVHVVSYLDPSRPTPVEVLGMQLVLWKDSAGTWRCFRDSCPHRRVPLSEGRVEGGELVCSYHGWRFNEAGACTAIPQAPDAKSLAAATASPRSCATSFPTQEAAGLLWVWPDDAPTSADDSAAKPAPLLNAFFQEQYAGQADKQWYMRDLPYDYDILVENITDPAHVPHAHHGLGPGVSRYNDLPMPFESLANILQPDDADMMASGEPPVCAYQFPSSPTSRESRVVFHAPSLVTYHTKRTGTMTLIYMVPVGPGRSKAFLVYSNSSTSRQLPPLMKALSSKVPVWLLHVMLSKLFDGDSPFLNMQGNYLRAREAETGNPRQWTKEYFMPMPSDRAVVAARRWMETVAGGVPVYPPDAPPRTEATREQALDRFRQHTRHCPDCRAALETTERVATASKALGGVSFFALCCLAGRHGFPDMFTGALGPTLGTVVVGLLALGAYTAALWLQRQFIFTDYVHADIE